MVWHGLPPCHRQFAPPSQAELKASAIVSSSGWSAYAASHPRWSIASVRSKCPGWRPARKLTVADTSRGCQKRDELRWRTLKSRWVERQLGDGIASERFSVLHPAFGTEAR